MMDTIAQLYPQFESLDDNCTMIKTTRWLLSFHDYKDMCLTSEGDSKIIDFSYDHHNRNFLEILLGSNIY